MFVQYSYCSLKCIMHFRFLPCRQLLFLSHFTTTTWKSTFRGLLFSQILKHQFLLLSFLLKQYCQCLSVCCYSIFQMEGTVNYFHHTTIFIFFSHFHFLQPIVPFRASCMPKSMHSLSSATSWLKDWCLRDFILTPSCFPRQVPQVVYWTQQG